MNSTLTDSARASRGVFSLQALSASAMVAHQGGWDEILLVAGPIAVIVGLLAVVKKRIDAHIRPGETAGRGSNESPGETTPSKPS